MADPDPIDYWLKRFAEAIEKAAAAPGEPSRGAYLELARHYWSMHAMIHGKSQSVPPNFPAPCSGRADTLVLRWAA